MVKSNKIPKNQPTNWWILVTAFCHLVVTLHVPLTHPRKLPLPLFGEAERLGDGIHPLKFADMKKYHENCVEELLVNTTI